MNIYRAELHIHTVLSPCADIEMIPPLIVEAALENGINLIAITDHNSSANVRSVQAAASAAGLTVLPGMELQTREEVHVLCLFETLEKLSAWQAEVDRRLPDTLNDPDHFGEQFIVDETGDFLDRENRLLLVSADLTIEQTFEGVNRLGGLAIPAHVDRRANGLLMNLGLVPPDIPVEALEISRHLDAGSASQKFPQLKGYPLIQGGDVHRLSEFLGANKFHLEAPTLAEVRKAIHNQEGRYLCLRSKNGSFLS